MSLEEITAGLSERIAANGALSSIIKFDFGDDGCITIDGKATPATVTNDNGDADCTIIVDMADFAQIASGELNAQMAFMSGKLRVEGDLGLAMQLGTILG